MVAFSDVECRRQQLTDGLAIGVTLTPTPGLENLGLQTPNPVQKKTWTPTPTTEPTSVSNSDSRTYCVTY